jgi:hypothetical protein
VRTFISAVIFGGLLCNAHATAKETCILREDPNRPFAWTGNCMMGHTEGGDHIRHLELQIPTTSGAFKEISEVKVKSPDQKADVFAMDHITVHREVGYTGLKIYASNITKEGGASGANYFMSFRVEFSHR